MVGCRREVNMKSCDVFFSPSFTGEGCVRRRLGEWEGRWWRKLHDVTVVLQEGNEGAKGLGVRVVARRREEKKRWKRFPFFFFLTDQQKKSHARRTKKKKKI